MSGSYLREQVQNLSFNFLHYKDKWNNRFQDMQDAHDAGYANFMKHVGKPGGGMPKDLFEDVFEVLANVAVAGMKLGTAPSMISIPLVLGVKKLAGILHVESPELPSFDTRVMHTKLADIKRAFRAASEDMSEKLKMLRDKAIMLTDGATYSFDADFRFIKTTMSKLLLSPLWYPPSADATEPTKWARPYEMRMWFRYWIYLLQTEPIWAYNMTKLPNLWPMFKRLKEIGWQPAGVDWGKVAYHYDSMWSDRFSFIEGPYKALRFLVNYSKNMHALTIQHKFPPEVTQYLDRAFTPRVWTLNNPTVSDSLLSPATMTWAEAMSWKAA